MGGGCRASCSQSGGHLTYTRKGSFASDVSVILKDTLPPVAAAALSVFAAASLDLGKVTPSRRVSNAHGFRSATGAEARGDEHGTGGMVVPYRRYPDHPTHVRGCLEGALPSWPRVWREGQKGQLPTQGAVVCDGCGGCDRGEPMVPLACVCPESACLSLRCRTVARCRTATSLTFKCRRTPRTFCLTSTASRGRS